MSSMSTGRASKRVVTVINTHGWLQLRFSFDQHNFANRAWKKMLDKCGIEHRKSYQTRHTFITLCIEAGINSTAIGRWTGTSAKMIDQHYGATNFTNLRPPSLC
jgi:integrase